MQERNLVDAERDDDSSEADVAAGMRRAQPIIEEDDEEANDDHDYDRQHNTRYKKSENQYYQH